MAFERNHDQIWSRMRRCADIMKFHRFMESDLIFMKSQLIFPGCNIHISPIDTDKFPEIMGFPAERKIFLVFIIVNRHDPVDFQDILQRSHGIIDMNHLVSSWGL